MIPALSAAAKLAADPREVKQFGLGRESKGRPMADTTSTDIQEIVSQDLAHVWHPMTQHRDLTGEKLTVVEKGSGTTVTDAAGNTYLDAYSGLWNVNVGYGREEIAKAVYEQMTALPYYPHTQVNVPAAKLAARLAEVLPGDLTHVYFSNSGSEANETALKIARQYARQRFPGQNRYKVIARYQGYHGWTFGAMSATGQVKRREKFEPLTPGFYHVDPPYCYRCPLRLSYPSCEVSCVSEIEEVIVREGPETVAAVIAEPIIGGGGVIVPRDEYLPRLREICDRYDVLLILDEVITGFGRTGRMFAAEHWGIKPDIMTMAKGVTSGYLPLGACAVTPEVFDAFKGEPGEAREFSQVVTYGGHPVCCAAALANLDILIRERLWENAARVGGHLLDGLRGIASSFVGNVRGKGLMAAVELKEESGGFLDAARTAQVVAGIREAGVIVGKMSHVMAGPESILFLSPPLVLTMEEADRIVDAVDQGLRRIS
jgi:adenosylmethionine-8-amino-7-oxononanoate aminotransferase